MDVFAAVVTLFLIMDPLGNILLFRSVLKTVPAARRRIVLVREVLFAYVVLLVFLFVGRYVLQFLRLEPETIGAEGAERSPARERPDRETPSRGVAVRAKTITTDASSALATQTFFPVTR